MRHLLRLTAHVAARHTLSFLAVAAILIVAPWAQSEWKRLRGIAGEIPILEQSEQAAHEYWSKRSGDIEGEVALLQAAAVAKLDARVTEIDEEIRTKKAAGPTLTALLLADKPLGVGMTDHAERIIDIELLAQQRAYLMLLRDFAEAAGNRHAAQEKLKQLWQAHHDAYNSLQRNRQTQAQLKGDAPFATMVPMTPPYKQLTALQDEENELFARNQQAHRDFLAQQTLLDQWPTLARPGPFRVNAERLQTILQPVRERINHATEIVSRHWFDHAFNAVRRVAPTALAIVLAACLLPLVMKLLFYFALAPLAARRPPIIVDGTASGTPDMLGRLRVEEARAHRISAVSHTLTVGKEDELLIRPDFLQSLPAGIRTDTKWMLDWRCPFTSLAAGLAALTRIGADHAESVVVSSTNDPLDEVALLALPHGAAMVLQPRSLVGVVYRRDAPLIITRHWRLGCMHAWLTLQLRYLVFRGPVTLVLKGRRGIRIEAAAAGRSVTQSATLGFSANTVYSTVRAEPFFPYLTNRQALFHDRFEGQAGFYVYEEAPHAGKRSGMLGRGLDGVSEAALKIFGI